MWIIGCLGLGLVLSPSLFFVSNSCANQILLGQCSSRTVLAEQSSGRNYKTDIDYREAIAVVFYIVGFSCILIVWGLCLIRHLILRQYGYSTGFEGYYFPWIDARMLREIIEIEESEKLRTFFKWINILIPALCIGDIFVLIIVSAAHPI